MVPWDGCNNVNIARNISAQWQALQAGDSCSMLLAETPTPHTVDLAAEIRAFPCLALTLCGQPSPAASLPLCAARTLAACPEMLACCARSDCTAPFRWCWYTAPGSLKLMHSPPPPPTSTPPPHPSPPFHSLVRSQVGIRAAGQPASAGSACMAASPASLCLAVTWFTCGVTNLRSARRTFALVLQEASPV
jgi:hypothetical protein